MSFNCVKEDFNNRFSLRKMNEIKFIYEKLRGTPW